ncbi:hypothetical protein RB2150_00365 [Rhodobacterales bacterium HTCC2150]|nr:hypothetical protein RB2150_00365 [Rhodobacterales bacterium HTCC2150] [Rhodobacteraceae bacterium HTCC2150]
MTATFGRLYVFQTKVVCVNLWFLGNEFEQ